MYSALKKPSTQTAANSFNFSDVETSAKLYDLDCFLILCGQERQIIPEQIREGKVALKLIAVRLQQGPGIPRDWRLTVGKAINNPYVKLIRAR